MGKEDIRVSRDVAKAIQWVIEDFLVKEYIQAHYLMIHAGRTLLMDRDLHQVQTQRRFREGFDICYNEQEIVRPACSKDQKVADGMVSKVIEGQAATSDSSGNNRGSATSRATEGENG